MPFGEWSLVSKPEYDVEVRPIRVVKTLGISNLVSKVKFFTLIDTKIRQNIYYY